MRFINKQEFDALTKNLTTPLFAAPMVGVQWWASDDYQVLGVLTQGRPVHEYSWVTVGRDEQLQYQMLEVGAAQPEAGAAREVLIDAIRLAARSES